MAESKLPRRTVLKGGAAAALTGVTVLRVAGPARAFPAAGPASAAPAGAGRDPGSSAGVGGHRVPDPEREVLHRQALQPAAAVTDGLAAGPDRPGREPAGLVVGRSEGAAASVRHLRARVFR